MKSSVALAAIWRTISRNSSLFVCRPGQRGDDARQSAAIVSFRVRVFAGGGTAPPGLEATELAAARVGTIRLRLLKALKIGTRIRVTIRKV
jgi:hypothetical protein